ncbi:MAG: hypothetical protein CVU89_09000 [Firmicutes bacterium HGW-Firmicutes-14]|nr:MAG: hypothetical protein CVU89_09000 [Firmicutes bacterium HGW-Firmicutes-14]
MTKKIYIARIIIAALMAVAPLLAGCGNWKKPAIRDDEDKKIQYLAVGGSGTNIPITRLLAEVFMEKNPDIKIEIPESLGSTGGIRSVNEGIIDIGMVSRELFPGEKNPELRYIPYAKVLIAFAVNGDLDIAGLSSQQLVGIYSGKISNWKAAGGPDENITVLTREETDSSRLIWNSYIKGFSELDISKEAVLLTTDQAMNEAISSIENSIGWTDLGAKILGGYNIRLLTLDGAEPTNEMAASGKYPFIKELAFVLKGEPDDKVSRFIDFVTGPQGTKILMENGYMPFEQDDAKRK